MSTTFTLGSAAARAMPSKSGWSFTTSSKRKPKNLQNPQKKLFLKKQRKKLLPKEKKQNFLKRKNFPKQPTKTLPKRNFLRKKLLKKLLPKKNPLKKLPKKPKNNFQ